MWEFVGRVKAFLLLFLVVTTVLLFLTGLGMKKSRFGTAYIKHQRLDSLTSRKIILIGGSNLHYGMNSQMLQDSLKMPVVNMGIQGSMGLHYMFDEVKDRVQKGDIIILFPEHSHFYSIDTNGEVALFKLLSVYPHGVRHLNIKQIFNSFLFVGPAIKSNLKDMQEWYFSLLRGKKKQSIYEQTNHFGDYYGHKGKTTVYKKSIINFSNQEISENTINVLQYIEEYLKEKEAHLMLGFAPIAKSESDSKFFEKIENSIPNKIILGNIEEVILPDSMFFDSGHHLLYKYRDLRTTILLENIRKNNIASDCVLKGVFINLNKRS